jgi:hypothetical protein
MFHTIRQAREALASIDLNGKTEKQKANAEIITNWLKPFDIDAAISPKNAKEIAKRLRIIDKDIIKMSKITKHKVDALLAVFSDELCILYWRWQNEKEYEDWGGYVKVMKTKFESLVIEHNMSNAVYYSCKRRPFGIVFDFEGFQFTMFVNKINYGWKSVQL